MVSDIAFIFNSCIPCGKTFSLVSRSSVNIGYEGHIFLKVAVTRALVFRTQVVYYSPLKYPACACTGFLHRLFAHVQTCSILLSRCILKTLVDPMSNCGHGV